MTTNSIQLHGPQVRTLAFVSLALLGGLLAGCENPDIPRIGVLHPNEIDQDTVRGFQAGLTELGYVDGVNVDYVYDGATGSIDSLGREADRLASRGVTLFFTPSSPATRSAQRAAKAQGTPIVFGPVNDPVAANFVATLTKPGGNITGVRLGATHPARLAWFKRIVPSLRTLLVPYNAEDIGPTTAVTSLRGTASAMGIDLVTRTVSTRRELLDALATMPQNIDGVFLVPDTTVNTNIPDIITATEARRIPVSGPSVAQVQAGALMSYGFDHASVGRQAARMAHEILKGVSPAKLPVEMADIGLRINLVSAKRLGIDIPRQYLNQAQTIIR